METIGSAFSIFSRMKLQQNRFCSVPVFETETLSTLSPPQNEVRSFDIWLICRRPACCQVFHIACNVLTCLKVGRQKWPAMVFHVRKQPRTCSHNQESVGREGSKVWNQTCYSNVKAWSLLTYVSSFRTGNRFILDLIAEPVRNKFQNYWVSFVQIQTMILFGMLLKYVWW